MADKKNLCAMIPADLHARVRLEQEQSGKTLSEFVEQLITDYYKMKEGTKMTGDMSRWCGCYKNRAKKSMVGEPCFSLPCLDIGGKHVF